MQETWLLSPASAKGVGISGTSLSGAQVTHLSITNVNTDLWTVLFDFLMNWGLLSVISYSHLYKTALELSGDFGLMYSHALRPPKLMCTAQGEWPGTERERSCESSTAEVQHLLRWLSCSNKIK